MHVSESVQRVPEGGFSHLICLPSGCSPFARGIWLRQEVCAGVMMPSHH